MKLIVETFKNTGNLHHAYIIEGETEPIREKLLTFIEKEMEHPIQGNPDFWHEKFDTFTIDDARNVREQQALKAIAYTRKIFVLEVYSMTVEAQNALLKIFEEPSAGTHFFIVTSSADVFLPTLRSRVIVVTDDSVADTHKAFIKKFRSALMAERMEMIAPIIEEKDKAQAGKVIDGLILELSKKQTAETASLLKELLLMRSYLVDRSPSLKLILEHIAVTLPYDLA